MNKYKWSLAINNFSWLDRLKICKFFLTPSNRWSQDKYVREYEDLVASYVGCRYAVFVSSGSTSNQLICQSIKDRLIKNGEWPTRNKVIVGAVTWQTNVSIWVREGFEPVFIDVNLKDFCLDYDKLEEELQDNYKKIACVFPTSVLGFTPNIDKLKELEKKYVNVKFALDNCEAFLGEYGSFFTNKYGGYVSNICNAFTSSTSCFVAHQISTGQEGGFIFTNSKDEYEYYLLSRAHGLLRNLVPYQHRFKSKNYEEAIGYTRIDTLSNPLVDKQFDFQTLSSNYRSSDISAFMGILDFKRVNKYKKHRQYIYNLFKEYLDSKKYYLPPDRNVEDCAFCLPIIIKGKNKEKRINLVKKLLDKLGIERRGFISGNMLRQLPYQKYGNYKDYKNAEYLNNSALYIGLNMNTIENQILELTKELNNI